MKSTPPSLQEAAPAVAIFYIFAAGFLFSCLDSSAKYLVLSGIPTAFISWMRFVEHAVLALIFFKVWSSPKLFKVRNMPLQLARGLCLFGSTYFNFQALQTMQLGETITITFAAPMVIAALAGPLLGEWAGWRRWAAIVVAFIGVLIIARPGFGAINPGLPYSITAMLSYSLYVLLTRRMAATESPESLIFFSALAPAILMSPAIVQATIPETPFQILLLLMLGFFGGLGHYLIVLAYRRASTAALAPYPFLQIIWMLAFGYFFFQQFPDVYTLCGAAIVIGSGLYVVHRERQVRLARLKGL
ncbi:DMT family transporter [Phyllobacterium endophyticum]|uniref:EamA family transporter n=1 Tax=Phyllobacterium endophyticum TaxID=1149773 RepID=A0A2P7AL35_9HYPH|nr:DMT family transporter [Phyllobacterium endophyticum]MBB3233165.1 drug/metabolite transporter (DMT)-like permease [Phyllobacterium endophyticum]PSH54931.1 EamA family transporter [Phyllobacterium endophyticum]TXR49724.1 DMT family transporter [Phyllobacterium endophyticum]TYR43190.1 DMT family transporter [Phyllobacterium endophyticum]